MLRIACDVLGTIDGPKKESVLAILKYLISEGHEVVVWSSEYSFAKKAVISNHITKKDSEALVEFRDKYSKNDTTYQDLKMFDIALEDDHGQAKYLASRTFLMVDRIPHNTERALEKIKELVNELEFINGYIEDNSEE